MRILTKWSRISLLVARGQPLAALEPMSYSMLRQATNIRHLQLPMMLPGITIDLSPSDYLPIEQVQLIRFDAEQWVRFGEMLGR